MASISASIPSQSCLDCQWYCSLGMLYLITLHYGKRDINPSL